MQITLEIPGFEPISLSNLDEVAPAMAQIRATYMQVTGEPLGNSQLTMADGQTYRVSPNGNVWDGNDLFHGRRSDGQTVRHGEHLPQK